MLLAEILFRLLFRPFGTPDRGPQSPLFFFFFLSRISVGSSLPSNPELQVPQFPAAWVAIPNYGHPIESKNTWGGPKRLA